MKRETLYNIPIPYESSVEELIKILSSKDMKDFSLACEALSYKDDHKAYEAMKSYINDKDKYRRLYILKTIFRHPDSVELIDFLESAITSEDFMFVENGLFVIYEHRVKVSESLLISAVNKHLHGLYTAVGSLITLDISEENYREIVKIFNKSKQCAQKEVIGEVLISGYLPSKSKELYELFGCNEFGKIRLFAVSIAKEYNYDFSAFLSDKDGHVRKFADL